MFNWRLENKESFYPTLQHWWKSWNFPEIPYDSLPTHLYVVYSDIGDLYAIPIYKTDSNICWIGFPTSNRDVSVDNKKGALDYILNVIHITLKYEGFEILLTTSNTPKLMKIFKNNGFIESDKNTNFYTKQL